MIIDDYLDKLHGEILEIVEYIDLFCKKNDIKYYLTGGTLLGAVRHQGFIPWDDDLDIAMPRSDYDRFIDLFSSDNNERYKLLSIYTDPYYTKYFAKVIKINTKFIEDEKYQWGIFVDIFPLDDTHKYSKKLIYKKKVIKFACRMRERILFKNKNELFKFYIAKLLGIKNWERIIDFLSRNENDDNAKFFVNYGSQYDVKRQTMPKEWFEQGIKIDFSGVQLNVPNEYEKVLKNIYGDNYMKLPPQDKRRTHYPIFVQFSDNEVIAFGKEKHKVSIDETL